MNKTTINILKTLKVGALIFLVADTLGAFGGKKFDNDRFEECMKNTMEDNDVIDVEYYEE